MVLLAAAGGRAQSSTMSVLTSWQPGHRLHLGVSAPDKRFDSCLLLASSSTPATLIYFQGVHLVVDPQAAVVAPVFTEQQGAKPGEDLSDTYKWYFNMTLDPGLLLGAPVYFQAVLLSSQSPGLFRHRHDDHLLQQAAAAVEGAALHVLRACYFFEVTGPNAA